MTVPVTPPDFLADALPESRAWSDRPRLEDVAALPACPAVYLLVDTHAAPVQLATTQSLRRLLVSKLTIPQQQRPGKADLAEITRGVRWRPLSTAFEGRWWYYRVARALYPQEYRRLISFGPAHFLHVDWTQPVPELRVTERIWSVPGEFVGPWPAHKACQEALAGLWDLFDLCRHPEQVRKSPRGTRCAYAEMGRCDAPCDGSVPLGAYVGRCRDAWRFACGGVQAWVAEAEQRMRQAAEERKYELAGQIKEQLRFAQHWQAQWAPRVRPAEELRYLLGLPVTRRRAWKLFLFRTGDLAEGPVVRERRLAPETLAWLGAQPPELPGDLPAVVRTEQTWLLAHLLFSRAAESVLLVPLARDAANADLERALTEQLASVVGRRGRHARAIASGSEGPDAATTEANR
jgi:excinuclease UvrABC nuclease subunit